MLRHYGVTASREKLQQVFAYYQSYGCGYIDLEDFYQLKRQLDLNRSEGGGAHAALARDARPPSHPSHCHQLPLIAIPQLAGRIASLTVKG